MLYMEEAVDQQYIERSCEGCTRSGKVDRRICNLCLGKGYLRIPLLPLVQGPVIYSTAYPNTVQRISTRGPLRI